MSAWKQALREGVLAGSVASVLSAAALLMAGRRENGHAAAPVNAISHWVWDRPALRANRPNLRHTLVGYGVHHGASIFWATLHARAWGMHAHAKRPGPALAGGMAAAAIACFVDFRMTPERLTPGFEHRLSAKALAAVYGCFALGLALGSVAASRAALRRR
jgi:hypothetical protein